MVAMKRQQNNESGGDGGWDEVGCRGSNVVVWIPSKQFWDSVMTESDSNP